MKYNIGGHEVKCVGIAKLAKMCGRASSSLRKLEQRGILPPANFRGAETIIGEDVKPGNRIYTLELAEKLAEIFEKEISQGIAIDDDTKSKLIQLFAEERTKLS